MNSDSRVFQLKLNVEYASKPVWRRFQVSSSYTFWDLHCAIQSVMGFEFAYGFIFHAHDREGHVHEFGMREMPNDYAAEPRLGWLFKIADYLPAKGSTILYLYELWFPWIFTIELEEILTPEKRMAPRCCGGEGRLLEHCGGALAFNEILEILDNPAGPEYESVRQKVGDGFDPSSFDPNAVLFDDPEDHRLWTMDLWNFAEDLLETSIPKLHSEIDSRGRFPVPLPVHYLNVLVEERLLPEVPSLPNPGEVKVTKRVRLSKQEVAALTEAVEFRQVERADPIAVRRLEMIYDYLRQVAEELADEMPVQRAEVVPELIQRASWDPLELPDPFPNCEVSLAAAVWRRQGHCLPAIVCRRKESGRYGFLAARVPYQSRRFSDAAETAKLDLARALRDYDLPKTEVGCRLFMPRIGYGIVQPVEFKNVRVVEE